MNDHTTQQMLPITLAIYAAVAVLLIRRYSRPMRISISRMWIGPVIFLAMTALAIWGEQQQMPAPAPLISLALAAGAVLGIPLGMLRGKHTTVKATERPGVMYLGPSWIVAVIWLGAYGVRAGLRIAFMGTAYAAPLGDGLLALAIAMLVTSYYVIYKKYRALEHEAGQI